MNQLATRYATRQMKDVWSEDRRLMTCRQLWIALAEAQAETGLADAAGNPRVRPEMVAELRSRIDTFKTDPGEAARLAELEEACRHDVVAHVRLLGELCPTAREVIHLGATSCDIVDNADLILVRDGLVLVRHRLVGVIDRLGRLIEEYADVPCVAYTHYQPAQFTTMGKRFALWAADLVDDLFAVEQAIDHMAFRGLKGATGTQASFLQLYGGDAARVADLESRFAAKFGFDKVYLVTGQTYSRKQDARVMAALSGIGQSLHKIGVDIRLLQHDGEVAEPFGATQVGSSAMPYKRNPMRSERMCGLARYLVNEAHNAEQTAMTQWLERTLDDSAVRRVSLPNAFLAADACLNLAGNVAAGLTVNRAVVRSRAYRELPFVLTESILMRAVKAGGDRQALHAALRDHARDEADRVANGHTNDLLRRLAADPAFRDHMPPHDDLDPRRHAGLAEAQAREYVNYVIALVRNKYPDSVGQVQEVKV